MSNETKDKTAAEIVAENMEAVTETINSGAATAEEVAKAAATIATAPSQKTSKGKKPTKTQSQESNGAGALHAVGKAACKRHGLPVVWVTADGQCFKQENDARNHGKSLGLSAEPLKVEAQWQQV